MLLLSIWLGYWLASQTPNASRQGGAPSVCIGPAIQSAWNHCLCVPWSLSWCLGLGWATHWFETVLINSFHIIIELFFLWILSVAGWGAHIDLVYFLLFTTAKFCGPHSQATAPPLWNVQKLGSLLLFWLFVLPHTTNKTTLNFQNLAATCTSSWGFTTWCPTCWD